MKKFIILDRDGVINQDSDNYIKKPEEWLPIPGSIQAIAKLTQSGYNVVVATNQSGLGRGLFDETTLQNIHAKMLEVIEIFGGKIQQIFYCPHHPDDGCNCRKPNPGLLQSIGETFNIPLKNIPFIGDSYKDIQAANYVGCQPILVKTGKGKSTLSMHPELLNSIPIFDDLLSASEFLLDKQMIES